MQETLVIDKPGQLKALGHPLRVRVLEMLGQDGDWQLTNRELAQRLGVDPGHLHFHVRMQAEQASRIIEQELEDAGITPERFVTERWLADEERWNDDPEGPDVEEDLLERGYAPWEVRVECEHRQQAHDLAEQLRSEGYDVSRTFTYVIVGTGTREEAVELAQRVHGTVEPGGELVYEVQPYNPFAVFGGLGG